MQIDGILFSFINGVSHGSVIIDGLSIFLAEYLGYIIVFIFLLFLFLEKSWRRRWYFFSLGALSATISWGVITEVLKFFINRPRPFLELGIEPLIRHGGFDSFPSGHIALFLPLALTLFYINRKVGIWSIIIVALVGIARIFVGIHWPSDILGGALIAVLSFYLVESFLLKKGYDKTEQLVEGS